MHVRREGGSPFVARGVSIQQSDFSAREPQRDSLVNVFAIKPGTSGIRKGKLLRWENYARDRWVLHG